MPYKLKIAVVVAVFILLIVLLFGNTKGMVVNGKNAKNIFQFFRYSINSVS